MARYQAIHRASEEEIADLAWWIAWYKEHRGRLLTGRLVQAVSAALTMPLLMNATLAIYPPERRGKVMGLVAMVFSAAPALGPTISGFIIDHFGWRWLFLLTVPLMLAAVLLVHRYLKVTLVEITRPRIDLLSVVL